MTTSKLPGRIAAVLTGAVLVLVLASAVSVLWMTRALDQQSREHASSLMRTALANVLQHTLASNLDHAKSLEAAQAVSALDAAWLAERAGASASYGEAFQLAVYWGGPLAQDVGWIDGRAEAVAGFLGPATLAEADARLRQVPLGAYEGVTFFARRGGELFAVAASRVEPLGPNAAAVPHEGVARLLVGRRVNGHLLDTVADSTLLDGIVIGRSPPEDRLSLPLMGADGRAVAHVSWRTPPAGTLMLHEMMPWFLVVGALATGLVLVGMALTRRSAQSLVAAERRSALAARTDALTGLPNRFAFGEMVVGPARAGERAILFLDLNGFKRINDTIGHAAGDLVIRWMAERLGPLTGPGCRVARIGGDEFVFVLTGLGTATRAAALAQAVEEALTVPFIVQGH
jgi:GGDEF domain-containing protein